MDCHPNTQLCYCTLCDMLTTQDIVYGNKCLSKEHELPTPTTWGWTEVGEEGLEPILTSLP